MAAQADTGVTGKDEIRVAIETSAAIKWPRDITTDFQMPAALAPDYQDIDELIPV